jgi:hypothetical protein
LVPCFSLREPLSKTIIFSQNEIRDRQVVPYFCFGNCFHSIRLHSETETLVRSFHCDHIFTNGNTNVIPVQVTDQFSRVSLLIYCFGTLLFLVKMIFRLSPSRSGKVRRMHLFRKSMTDDERRISDLRAQSVMDRYKTTFRPKKSRRVEDLKQEVAGLSLQNSIGYFCRITFFYLLRYFTQTLSSCNLRIKR